MARVHRWGNHDGFGSSACRIWYKLNPSSFWITLEGGGGWMDVMWKCCVQSPTLRRTTNTYMNLVLEMYNRLGVLSVNVAL